ncbi:MAG: hypothetical protein RIG63_07885 [Coleofasciculus chthonoplastes F3-SA18-01]|uniref:hypothetical protein n=2 Tax=Coleofasciculus chthonoplastes TaxID=64178 RepID=UPI00330322AB
MIGDREIETSQLQCEHTWVSRTIPESMSMTQPLIVSPNRGLRGQIWMSRSPKWISDITSESLSPIFPIAELRSAFGFPIQDDKQILGVFEQRGMIDVKGRGKMTTYFLIAVK